MGVILTNLTKEVTPVTIYEGSSDCEGIVIVKIVEKSLINKTKEDLFINVQSFANELGVSEKELIELICYSPVVKEYLAYYRDEKYKVIKIFEIKGLSELLRMLKGLGTDREILKETKRKIDEMLNKIEEKEGKSNGEN